VQREVFESLRDELLSRLRDVGRVDGVLLVLYGALLVDGYDDGTGKVLRAVRRLPLRRVRRPLYPLDEFDDRHAIPREGTFYGGEIQHGTWRANTDRGGRNRRTRVVDGPAARGR